VKNSLQGIWWNRVCRSIISLSFDALSILQSANAPGPRSGIGAFTVPLSCGVMVVWGTKP
jgi:hypothetical protein